MVARISEYFTIGQTHGSALTQNLIFKIVLNYVKIDLEKGVFI